MKEIKIRLKNKPYKIFIGDSILDGLISILKKLDGTRSLFFIIDGNVENLHGNKIREAFNSWNFRKCFYKLNPGEESKSYGELHRIYNALLENNFDRESLIISVGGGVTGDLAGFAASTFMRGIRIIHIPTTIISAVDSSIGGKTGINFNKKKNMIGSFHQPELIFIDTSFLETLPEDEITSGLGEIVKYGFLTNEDFFNYVSSNIDKIYELDKGVINQIIRTSVRFKGSVVANDEKESGLRKILNLGHTFAHAFESIMDFKILHGEAVGAGIIAMLFLSNNSGILSDKKLKILLDLPLKMKLSSQIDFTDNERLVEIMRSDKKSSDGEINFVLLRDIGKILLNVSCEKGRIFDALEKTKSVLDSKQKIKI